MGLLEKLIFGTIVIALPLGEVARFSFNEVTVSLLDVGIALTVIIWLLLKRKIFDPKLSKPIFVFAFLLLLSLLVNIPRLNTSQLLISSLYLIRWIFYGLIYFIILDFKRFKEISNAMVIGGAIIVFLGFVQYFLYPDLRNLRYAGWDEHLYRLFSTFLDPNFAGSFFVFYFLFLADRLAKKSDIFTKIFSALSFTAIILTFSRSAYLALIVGTTTLFFLKGKTRHTIQIILIFMLATLVALQISPRSEGTKIIRTASGEARLDSIKHALAIFKDYPIFGVGFDSYRYAQKSYGFLDESKMAIHSGAGTDNSFLFILATSGIIGLIGLIYLLIKIISLGDPLIASSLIALIINSLFINSLFYPPIMLWIWIVVALKRSN